LKALEEGAYVKHFQYGLGIVTASNSDRTSIDFDAHGIKKFVTSMMVVDHAEGTPPKKRRTKKLKDAIAAAAAHETSKMALAAGAK
jgi:phosphoglycolate phosphatase-like HAD superfamily hydrolase